MISNNPKRITSSFGSITINNTNYSDDVILYSEGTVKMRDKSLSNSMKGEYGGHTPLSKAELIEYLGVPGDYRKKPVVFIGTGQNGKLPLTPDAKLFLQNFTTVIKPTPEVLILIQKELRKYIAIIHTTC